jgi:uncharacterized protein (DUF2267 family)
MRRLGWHDRERSYLALLAALHALRDCLPRDEAVYVGARLPVLLAASTMKAGIPADTGLPRAAVHSWSGSTTAYTAIRP